MFCNRCGTTLQPDFNVCPKCGTPVTARSAAADPARFAGHVRTLGILWIVLGAIWLVPSFFLLTMGRAVHFFPMGGGPFTHLMVPPLMFGLGAGFLVLAAGGICVGWGLLRHEPWARIAAIVLGILSLLHPPLGTLLGIYTLWVLLSKDSAVYESAANPR